MLIRSFIILLFCCSISHAQLMEIEHEKILKSALPTIEDKEINDYLHGKKEGKYLFYTEAEMPFAHQDHEGFHLSSHNYSARSVQNGGTEKTGNCREFPWRNPGGTDGNVYAWKIMYLPPNQKITIFRTNLQSGFANVGVERGWDWKFPEDTKFFECLSFKTRLSVFEVRMRHKTGGKWRSKVFRPPYGGSNGKIKKISFSDIGNHPKNPAFDLKADVPMINGLPTINDVDLYLTYVPFKVATDCPTTDYDIAILPKEYKGYFVHNNCNKCHEDAGKHVMTFNSNRDWYGYVRGSPSEKILSFHPISSNSLSNNGAKWPVKINSILIKSNIVEKYP